MVGLRMSKGGGYKPEETAGDSDCADGMPTADVKFFAMHSSQPSSCLPMPTAGRQTQCSPPAMQHRNVRIPQPHICLALYQPFTSPNPAIPATPPFPAPPPTDPTAYSPGAAGAPTPVPHTSTAISTQIPPPAAC
eukprot:365023-Chlamydomonas_euryale.AAC.14